MIFYKHQPSYIPSSKPYIIFLQAENNKDDKSKNNKTLIMNLFNFIY